MSLRERGGNWHYRFFAAGRTWTADTGLAATERNRNAALRAEVEARKLISEGRPEQLKVQPKPFSDAADQFIEWAKGEHREKKETWKRLRVSMTSLRLYFKLRPLHTITVGQVQDYMSWRRLCPECTGDGCEKCDQTGQGVKEITLRHDLHALSPLFKYGIDHNWCSANPVERVKMPSDADAVRIHVLTPAEEMLYFETCKRLAAELQLWGWVRALPQHAHLSQSLVQSWAPFRVFAQRAHLSQSALQLWAWVRTLPQRAHFPQSCVQSCSPLRVLPQV